MGSYLPLIQRQSCFRVCVCECIACSFIKTVTVSSVIWCHISPHTETDTETLICQTWNSDASRCSTKLIVSVSEALALLITAKISEHGVSANYCRCAHMQFL